MLPPALQPSPRRCPSPPHDRGGDGRQDVEDEEEGEALSVEEVRGAGVEHRRARAVQVGRMCGGMGVASVLTIYKPQHIIPKPVPAVPWRGCLEFFVSRSAPSTLWGWCMYMLWTYERARQTFITIACSTTSHTNTCQETQAMALWTTRTSRGVSSASHVVHFPK